MATAMFRAPARLMTVAVVAACVATLGFSAPRVSAASNVIHVTLTDNGFEPAEIPVTVGTPFKLWIENKSSAPAEVESGDLRFEKVVVVGKHVTVRVRPLDAGTYEFFNDFKPEVKGHVVAQ